MGLLFADYIDQLSSQSAKALWIKWTVKAAVGGCHGSMVREGKTILDDSYNQLICIPYGRPSIRILVQIRIILLLLLYSPPEQNELINQG